MTSVRSRLRLASHSRMRCQRERPRSFGPSPIGKRALVAISIPALRFGIASPIISSECAAGIDVGGVDQVDAGVGDDVDQLAHLVERSVADLGEVPFAAEGHRAHRQHRDLEARIAKLPVFHRALVSFLAFVRGS